MSGPEPHGGPLPADGSPPETPAQTPAPGGSRPPNPPVPYPLEEARCPFAHLFRERGSMLDRLSARSYGMKMGQYRVPFFTTIFMPNEPALLRRALVDERGTFPKDGRYWSLLRPLMGDSILNSDGEMWKRQRRMIDPAFAQARLKIVFPLMQDAVGLMVGRFAGALPAGRIEIDTETTHVTADVILRALLSLPLSGADSRLIYDAFQRFTATLPARTLFAIGRLPEWLGAFFGRRRGERAAKEIRRLLEERIRPRHDAHRAGGPGPQQDILAGLLEARDTDGSVFTFDEVVDHTAMLFLAGHETSASALAWAIYLIATHPGIQQRMADEIAAEVGDRPLEFADLKKFRLTLDVFRETLRLYPPVGFLPREAAGQVTMRDKTIAPGCPVLITPWLVHRHRKLWQEPDAFDPDRFRRGADDAAIAEAYLPFGMGPRMCIGMAFAIQEAVLVLASLVRRFRFAPLPGEVPYPFSRLTIRPQKPIRVALSDR